MTLRSSPYDIVLLMPPMWSPTAPWPAAGYLVENLREQGWRVKFIDYNIRLYQIFNATGYASLWDNSSLIPSWTTGKLDYLVHLLDLNELQAPVIGICTTGTNRSFSVALAHRIRHYLPDKKIILGGHAVYFPHEVALVPLTVADAICKGEGETVICEVLEKGFSRLEEISGLYLPDDAGWRLTRERPLLRDLDMLPWPRYEDISLQAYSRPYLGLVGSRGCLGRCIFCSERLRFCGHRCRSAENQVEELEHFSSYADIEHFPYYDALANGNYDLMADKAREIMRRGLTVDYSGNLMIRNSMPDELFSLLRKSGFSVAFIGVESGSAATLAAMRKRHSPTSAAAFLRKCHEAGIRTELNFIIGFPTETEQHFEETLNFLRANQRYIDTVISVNTYGLGASDLWEMRDQLGIVVEDEQHFSHAWHTRTHPNDISVRQKRLERFLALEEELGLLGEALISDKYTFETWELPDPQALLSAYDLFFKTGNDADRKASAGAIHRTKVALGIDMQHPLELLHGTALSLRKRGVLPTIKHIMEWCRVKCLRRILGRRAG